MRGAHEFTRDDIEDLLAALGARLQARGVAAAVYVVGGAAIVTAPRLLGSPHRGR